MFLTKLCLYIAKKLKGVNLSCFEITSLIIKHNGRVSSALAPRSKGRGFEPPWFQKNPISLS